MATFATVSSNNSNYTLRLVVTEDPNSVNVALNQTTVAWYLYIDSTYARFEDYTVTANVVLNGSTVYSNSASRSMPATRRESLLLSSGTTAITHDADGGKTLVCAASISMQAVSYTPGNVACGGSMSLTTIPRATTPTIGAVTLGSAVTIGLPRASGAFTHNLRYAFGGASGTIATGAGASASWTPPLTLANQIPSAVSGVGVIYCDTYNGSTLIGSKSIGFTASVPASVKPTIGTCTVAPVNTNAWISGKGVYVVGYSKVRVQTPATGVYGSTIKSIAVSLDGRSYSGADITSAVLQTAGGLTITATATDTRGRTATTTTSITALAYAAPAINSLAYQRGTYSGGTFVASDSGEDIKVTFSLSMALAAQENKGAITVSCTGEDNQTTANAAAGDKTYYFTTIGVDNTREVTVSVTDSVGTTGSKSQTVATIEVPLNIDAPNNRIAIGGIAEKPKTLQVKWPAEFTGGLKMGDVNLDYPIEQGTSGIWAYIKLANGIAACWGAWQGSLSPFDSALNGAVYGYKQNIAFPFSFVDYPHVHYSARAGSNFSIAANHEAYLSQMVAYVFSNVSGTQAVTFDVLAVGRWK